MKTEITHPAEQADTLQQYTETSGMPGEPLPYLIRSDWSITCILLVCFILLSFALRNGKKYIAQYMKTLFRHKERASLFDESGKQNGKYIFTLIIITCILSGVCLYRFFIEKTPVPESAGNRISLLAGYIGIVFVYILIKWGGYSFINWIFFYKDQNISWLQTYFGLVGILCFPLFPFTLLNIFFTLNFQISLYLAFSILFFAKILLFYKSIRNFFNHFHGILHLILYFCALEIIPILLLWKGITYINNILI